jgi:hypothetical protein
VYTIVAAGDISFVLCYFESLVLPLQGFWNCIIYITTSLGACRKLWRSIFHRSPVSERIILSHVKTKRRFSRIDERPESLEDLAAVN